MIGVSKLTAGLALAGLLLGLAGPSLRAQPLRPAAPDRLYGYRVVKAYPHDPGAFTEGLQYQDGYLLESTGLVGRSNIRKVRLETGEVVQKRDLGPPFFGEGIVSWGDKLVQLTWQHHVGFIYDAATFAPRGQFKYRGEGWSLTKDDRRIIMSDGTDEIRFLDPATLAETGRIKVTFRGQPLRNLNELEWVKGEIYANVWQTDMVVRIDPRTGVVVGRINLGGLLSEADRRASSPDVLNGIAYDAKGDRLFVTGKQWPKLYEIKLVEVSPRP
jgi:glutaminyl-peptide cyclotransferase